MHHCSNYFCKHRLRVVSNSTQHAFCSFLVHNDIFTSVRWLVKKQFRFVIPYYLAIQIPKLPEYVWTINHNAKFKAIYLLKIFLKFHLSWKFPYFYIILLRFNYIIYFNGDIVALAAIKCIISKYHHTRVEILEVWDKSIFSNSFSKSNFWEIVH